MMCAYTLSHLSDQELLRDLNAVHAALGERIFFAPNRAAVRLEARAYYRGPGAGFGSQDEVLHLTGSVGMTFFVGSRGPRSRGY